ncbi:hypothetical protein GQX73_g325 [Xylaria multiplex]|uniref:Uncharacterized protein n=1 Tax=Xylaria multiplex TaxID=323545 RepID=A0A7C8N159_9PEZI|nr:hypothetical protein GQX73_g325 [Xylaria multiplex]
MLLSASCPTLVATSSAYARAFIEETIITGCSRLEALPNELKLVVVFWVQDPRSIFHLALTGPVFCEFVTTHETVITQNIINWNIPVQMMRLAIFSDKASRVPANPHTNTINVGMFRPLDDSYIHGINTIVNRFRRDREITFRERYPHGMRLSEASRYLRNHELIRYYAKVLASDAMARTPKNIGFPFDVSSTVLFRYEKALYIMQLVADLFAWRGGSQKDEMYKAWGTFWFAFHPWEIEQVFCVQKLLEKHISRVISQQFENQELIGLPHMPKYRLSKFVVFEGPTRLGHREIRGSEFAMSTAFRNFLQWNHAEFIFLGYAAPGFGLQINLSRMSARLQLSPTLDEVDIGPMKAWYHIALHGDLESTSRPRNPRSFFASMRSLISAGYALWDEIDPKILPTPAIGVMHREVQKKYSVLSESLSGTDSARACLYAFRSLLPQTQVAVINPQHPAFSFYVGEYCYYTKPEVLAGKDEHRLFGPL